MNERIKALMGKTLDSEFSHTWDTMTYEGLLQFSEKFAELIVRECMEVTKNYTCTSTWDYSAPVALARHFEIGPNYIVYSEIGVEE